MSDTSGRSQPFRVVAGIDARTPAPPNASHSPRDRDLDWSILMARGQRGESDAYCRLLEEITPYLRSLAARRHRDPSDIEDAVQDIIVTVHAIRATYDPTRPFAPWLVAIANRRLIDRLRRQGRRRAREIQISDEHETFVDPRANLEERAEQRGLEAAVDRLPKGQQQAIRLLKLKEMSLAEASVASGLSIAALKVATHRAVKSLREMLSKRSEP
jgi:RNA polymerase sigma factor (sigma-70 family)